MKGFREKCKKTSIFGHFGQKWPILDSFWPKWPKREFFPKSLWNIFSLLKALINCKVSEKRNEGIPRKMRKTSIFRHFGPKWPILDIFWPKWTKRDFFQKALGTFFPHFQALRNKHAILGLSTNLDLIKFLVFKRIKGITGD